MEMTKWQYQLTTGDDQSTVLGEGTIEAPKDRELKSAAEWVDVLADLSKQSGLGIQLDGQWYHYADSNFSPLEDDGAITKGQIRYGLGPHMGNRVNVGIVAV
ncbi:MAG: hypothetical protein VCA57_19010 [Pseudomonas sp.]|uniref:hypothetical protein n=1 Tax=Pseudomonas sp. TaxID=306 RepID=UPI0039819FD4